MVQIHTVPMIIPTNVKILTINEQLYVKGPLGILKAHSNINNTILKQMIKGVKEGYNYKIKIVGVGYRAVQQNYNLEISIGYNKPVIVPLPMDPKLTITNSGTIINGHSKLKPKVAQFMNSIVLLRPAKKDIYKHKGIEKINL